MAAGNREEDPYHVLGVPKRASHDEVKKAYRQLSRLYHPDKAGHLGEAAQRDRERQMVSLNVAYQVLMSPRQRQEYDLAQQVVSDPVKGYAADWQAYPGREPWKDRPSAGNIPSSSAPAKPRYASAGKYTQSSRHARRMDPAQYTTHVDGRAAEFIGLASKDVAGVGPIGGSHQAPSACLPPYAPKNPTWLQRQLDVARDWEDAHCPPEARTEKYEWKRAGAGLLGNLRERRQQRRDQLDREDTSSPTQTPD